LISHPSYADLLVSVAKEHGYSEKDFGLERILLGGEILTSSAKQRIGDFFNSEVHEVYNCSELIPVSGAMCHQGNLHFGEEARVEVLDYETLEEVAPNEKGFLCVTPFYPLRQGTLLLRYAPGDIVKRIDGCSCGLGGSVTSNVCGKFDPLLMKSGIDRRMLLEAVEKVPDVSLPLRVNLCDEEGDLALHLCVSSKSENTVDAVHSSLEKLGLKQTKLFLHLPGERFSHYPNRSELQEDTFHSLRREGVL
jgi:phenylacetate-CoA ligase